MIDLYKALYDLYIKYNTIKSYYAKSAMTGKKGETECCFIRRTTQVKHSILIRSDRKCFETFKILH